MRRGTTPTFVFHLKNKDGSAFDTNLITDVRVTFKQVNPLIPVVVERTLKSCELSSGEISVTLTQEETLKFNCYQNVEVQIKAKLPSGKVIPTAVHLIPIGKILNEEVL